MVSYIWPIVLIVASNVAYQVCAKSTPEAVNPLAALTVTYLTAALASGGLYFALNRDGNLLAEYGRLNWVPFVFGLTLVGLEAGFIYAYKAGWPVSSVSIVQSAFLAAALLLVGAVFYHETVTWSRIAGVVICMVGLYFLNR